MLTFQTRQLSEKPDAIAPDGSEIRELLRVERGSMAHCTLPPGGMSQAVKHKTIDEIWYCLQGHGQFWRKQDGSERIVSVLPGICLTVPAGTAFQFRTIGEQPLRFIIATMPPWPGDDEALAVQGLSSEGEWSM